VSIIFEVYKIMSKVLQQYGGLWRWFSEFTSLKLYFGILYHPNINGSMWDTILVSISIRYRVVDVNNGKFQSKTATKTRSKGNGIVKKK
jgi:hypothetical protein